MAANTWRMANGTSLEDSVAYVLSTGDTLGYTADEIADALGLPIDGTALQSDLEDMVYRGILDRRGIGRGTLYTLMASASFGRPAPNLRVSGLALEEQAARKAG